MCSECKKELPARSFTKNQLKKPIKKCQACAENVNAQQDPTLASEKMRNVEGLREAARVAEASGTPAEKMKTAAAAAAAEAELVTGLKPMVIGRKGGKSGRGRGGKGHGGKA